MKGEHQMRQGRRLEKKIQIQPRALVKHPLSESLNLAISNQFNMVDYLISQIGPEGATDVLNVMIDYCKCSVDEGNDENF